MPHVCQKFKYFGTTNAFTHSRFACKMDGCTFFVRFFFRYATHPSLQIANKIYLNFFMTFGSHFFTRSELFTFQMYGHSHFIYYIPCIYIRHLSTCLFVIFKDNNMSVSSVHKNRCFGRR